MRGDTGRGEKRRTESERESEKRVRRDMSSIGTQGTVINLGSPRVL